MLACARIGAAHSVVFGGFSAQSLADRINDAEAKVLITADGGYRRGEVFPLKPAADEACADTPSIEHVVVVKRGGNDVDMVDGRDHWYHELMDGASTDCPAEPMDAEQLLFLLYTSGTTGKPKGIMHTTGGYLTHVTYTHKYVFDLHPDTDVFWCTADVGWITGHSYIVYGPLANGATQVMYEGVPEPSRQRPVLGDRREVRRHDLLHRADGDPHVHEVGRRRAGQARPVVAAAARHGRRADQPRGVDVVPRAHRRWRCPIVDTWWQTETGGIMISPLPGATTTKPGSATFPLPGVSAEVIDDEGNRSRSVAATSPSPGRGPACCAASGATPSASATPTGRGSRAATSPATAPSSTTTATSGCSAGSTT
jgi:acetyl-CoA synthetase